MLHGKKLYFELRKIPLLGFIFRGILLGDLFSLLLSFSYFQGPYLVQFLTGHNYLRYHLYVTGVSESKECRLCQDGTEDAWHLLTQCEPLLDYGMTLF